MLYLSTRNKIDAFTAQRALRENRAADGGLYVPFRLPVFPPEELRALSEQSFHSIVASVLNLLFNTKLTGLDVSFSAGRLPVRVNPMSHRILIAECWHNPWWDFSGLVKTLSCRLRVDGVPDAADWTVIGVRIAVLFGIFGELIRSGIAGNGASVDISTVCGDFSGPMAAWYARKMGLPVGNIVCGCNENGSLWDLIHHGQLRTDTVCTPTSTPEADFSVPYGLERLVYGCGGYTETQEFVDCCRTGRVYSPSEYIYAQLRDGIYVSVISGDRLETVIPSVYRTNSCLLSPYTALAYAGLLDYRVNTGESRYGLILADKSPVRDADTVANALGIPRDALTLLIDQM